jgi:ribosome-associated protein
VSEGDSIRIGPSTRIPLSEIEVRAMRSSGPGGQHANVTASRIEASFDVAASAALSDVDKQRISARLGPRVRAIAQDTRSQARNRELALERLRGRLEDALRPRKRRRATRPSRGARERRLEQKRRQSERKRARRRPGRDEY